MFSVNFTQEELATMRSAAKLDAKYTADEMTTVDRQRIRLGGRTFEFIDALPPGTNAPGNFKPDPEATGPFLYGTDAVLGVQCFIPEVWTGRRWDWYLLRWKHDFSRRWYDTGIPFIMDVSPGYDNHLVFPLNAFRYGHTAAWRKALTGMVADFGSNGLVYNSWNGFTEGMAAVPLREPEFGDVDYRWLQSLQ